MKDWDGQDKNQDHLIKEFQLILIKSKQIRI